MKAIKILLQCIVLAGFCTGAVAQDGTIADVDAVKELIHSNPADLNKQMKGFYKKNKHNPENLVAFGRAFLDANDMANASEAANLALEASNRRYAPAYILLGDIADADYNGGEAVVNYEMAIYYDKRNPEPYIKYARIYTRIDPEGAIAKMEELKAVLPDYPVDDFIDSLNNVTRLKADAEKEKYPPVKVEPQKFASPAEEAAYMERDILRNWRGMENRRFITIHKSPNYRQIVINEYETDYQYNDGMLAVCNKETGMWGFYDENGNLLPGGFKWGKGILNRIPAFGAGHCIVTRTVNYRRLCYVIDKQGRETLIEGLSSDKIWPFNNGGIAAVGVGGGWPCYIEFYNTRGQRVLTNVVARECDAPIGDFIDGWARVYLGEGYTYVDKNGKLMPMKFKQAQDFSDGLAAVAVDTQNGRRWGFINTEGDMVIQPRFSKEPSPFSYGYAVVQKQNDMMVFINKEGKVCSEEAVRYSSFVEGFAFGGNDSETWIVDTRMQRHKLAEGANGVPFGRPQRTVFNGRYIVSTSGSYYYGNGYDESSLYDPATGLKYDMAPYQSFDHISPHRIHVSFKSSTTLKENQEGFIDENGLLVLEFVKDEF